MNIRERVSLDHYSTFHVGGEAEFFTEVSTEDELREAIAWAHSRALSWRVIGGGSNILFADAGVKGLTIKIAIGGIEITKEDAGTIVSAGAGVVLDDLVREVCAQEIWGLENLSAIPGTVGATPVQNVGAYGTEVGELIRSVSVYDVETDNFLTLDAMACEFQYRHSVFKEEKGKRYVITEVTFFLPESVGPRIAYRDLVEYFKERESATLTPTIVRRAVTDIRREKFPDWTKEGTAGSFFKNPLIPRAHYEHLLRGYPEMPGHSTVDDRVKIPLGWILDRVCNMRGVRTGSVGTYPKQALVLVNYGGASEKEVVTFAEKISACVFEKTEITIEWEVTRMK